MIRATIFILLLCSYLHISASSNTSNNVTVPGYDSKPPMNIKSIPETVKKGLGSSGRGGRSGGRRGRGSRGSNSSHSNDGKGSRGRSPSLCHDGTCFAINTSATAITAAIMVVTFLVSGF